ncbi:MAG: NADH-quinone oxidoreductase subunit C [Spirochaetia bacterium]|jgi:ech hydrogenase subunit D
MSGLVPEEMRKLAPDPQTIEEIPVGTLLERAQRMRSEGWRLVQASCTRLVADQEVNYSFDRDGQSPDSPDAASLHGLHTLRVRLPMANPELPSISQFYWQAFLYENEMHDLFGIAVKGMALDFNGHFYTTMEPFPYVTREQDHGD